MMSKSLQELQSQIQSMPSDRVKSIVMFWLASEQKTIVEFEQLVDDSEDEDWGDLPDFPEDQMISEDEMVAESLAIFAAYQKNPKGIPHRAMKQWAESLGQDNELPCPR
jgi:hypothetical protein